MKRREKKTKPLILYEKYKYEHHLSGTGDKPENMKKSGPSVMKRIGNMFMCFILTGMIFLSGIGIIALLQPQMRMMLLEILVR